MEDDLQKMFFQQGKRIVEYCKKNNLDSVLEQHLGDIRLGLANNSVSTMKIF